MHFGGNGIPPCFEDEGLQASEQPFGKRLIDFKFTTGTVTGRGRPFEYRRKALRLERLPGPLAAI